jgi:hypothetical protein
MAVDRFLDQLGEETHILTSGTDEEGLNASIVFGISPGFFAFLLELLS